MSKSKNGDKLDKQTKNRISRLYDGKLSEAEYYKAEALWELYNNADLYELVMPVFAKSRAEKEHLLNYLMVEHLMDSNVED